MTPPRNPSGPRSWQPDALVAQQASQAEPAWRRGATPGAAAGAGRYVLRRQLAVIAAGILAFAAGLVYVVLWLAPPPPAALVLLTAGYEDNLAVPHNVYGRAGVEALAELTRSTFTEGTSVLRQRSQLRLRHDPLELSTDGDWSRGLDGLGERTAFVVFALHGAADADGAYLIPHDGTGQPDPANRLRLKAVIERLGRMPKQKHKVLVLDATQPPALPQFGALHNDFARALRDLEPAIAAVPNLVVFAASDLDQRSWSSPDLRRTAFGHFLFEGLKGDADKNLDTRISLAELVEYVTPRVQQWARQNRNATQTPFVLPAGEEGERRAAAVHLCMIDPGTPRANFRDLPPYTPPADLASAWDSCRRLGESKPEPAIYAPHLWQQYLATLVRHEQLLRAGDDASAGRLANRLRDVAAAIDKARRLDLASVRSTVAFPAALGIKADERVAAKMFADLWDGTPINDLSERWAGMWEQQKGDAASKLALRLKLVELTLDKAADEPASLDRARALLAAVNDDPARPTAEAHLLTMLRRDLPQSPPPATLTDGIALALRTRRQAERAVLNETPTGHPYWEHAAAWTRDGFSVADGDRRLAQDRLFSTDAEDWGRAKATLADASKRYDAVRKMSEEGRVALSIRERAVGMLPHYSCWLSKLARSSDPQKARDEEVTFREFESLWNDVHQLTVALERTQLDLAGQPPTAGPLGEKAAGVNRRLADLDTRFLEAAREMSDLDALSPYRDADDVLCVPFADAGLRLKIIAGERRVSRRLLESKGANDLAVTSAAADTQRVQEQSARLGRLLLATLGRPWFDATESGDRESFENVSRRLENFRVEEKWWKSLTTAGRQIGDRRAMLVEGIAARAKLARDTDPRTDLPAVRKARFEADRLGRLLDGSQAALVPEGPAEALRKLLVSEWLVTQARRTLDDHFFAEAPDAAPYYRVVGNSYLDDARRLVGKLRPPTALQAAQEALNAPSGLVFDAPPSVAVTSEQRFGIDYRVLPAAGSAVRAGVPVLWVEADGGVTAVQPAPLAKFPRELSPDRPADLIPVLLGNPLADDKLPAKPEKQTASVTVRGLFRGQRFERRTPVALFPAPELARVTFPTPPRTSVAVRADREIQAKFASGAGSVAIVLDCSGSMGEEDGTAYTPSTKYVQATTALRRLLGKLPAGTRVSLWVFGQREPGAERKEDADRTVKPIVRGMSWEPALLDSIMARVEHPAITPWNETPVVRAMIRAKDDLVEATGFKTLLVITDGDDNRFEFDRELNPKKQSIPDALREQFANSGIVVQVVGFRFPDGSETKAAAQFRVVESFPMPGRFQTVNQAEELAIALEKAVRQRVRYWVDGEDNAKLSVVAEEGMDVSPVAGNAQWFPGGLEPGPFKLRAVTDTRTTQSVLLQAGEPLMVNLTRTPRGAYFQRAFVLRDDYANKPYAEAKDWRLAAVQNQRVGGRGAQLLLGLEKDPAATQDTTLTQSRPREVWFDVKAAAGERFRTRIGTASNYPFAAWGVDVPAWPDRSRPQVTAYWNPVQEFPPTDSIECGPGLESLLGINRRSVRVDGDTGAIEGVAVEQHTVEVSPGMFEPRPCLVMRVRPPADKPVYLRPRGLNPAGQEHRYYTEAGKYTALFWPVDAGAADAARVTVQVISLDAFMKDAKQRGFAATLPLGEPQAGDARPPAVDVR